MSDATVVPAPSGQNRPAPARNDAGSLRITETPRLRVEMLHPHLRNVRRQVGDLDELTESVRAIGVLQPLMVAPHPDLDGEWVIIAGRNRSAYLDLPPTR